jgi:hypothetical protein
MRQPHQCPHKAVSVLLNMSYRFRCHMIYKVNLEKKPLRMETVQSYATKVMLAIGNLSTCRHFVMRLVEWIDLLYLTVLED